MDRTLTRLSDAAGSDAPLPRWLRAAEPPPERPRFDSVAISGNGIGALALAARLARSQTFAGRIVVAGSPVTETRRLLGGVTLRARALDYYAAAFGTSREALLHALYDGAEDRARTTTQVGSCCERGDDGSMRVVRPGEWMNSRDHGGRALAYGIRNSHLADRLTRLAQKLPITFHTEPVDSVEALRELAPGSSPLLVNATTRPLRVNGERPALPPPRAFVVACQIPFANARRREAGVLPDGAGFFGCTPRAARNDVAIFNPLVDPLSPRAEYYGIEFRIVPADPPCDREAAIGSLRDQLHDIGRAMGLEPLDPDETEGQAMVPCSDWRDIGDASGGLLELNRIYHAGRPIITGDGMTKAGLAALVTAEAVLAGEEPVRLGNRALRRWRGLNTALALGMTHLGRVAAFSIRRLPGPVLGGAAGRDFWAGIA